MGISLRYKVLLKNTGLMFFGTFSTKIVSFIMLPFYTLWLSVEDYGTIDVITAYSTIIVTVISLGIAEAIFVIPSQKDIREQTSYFTSSQVFAAFCIIILLLSYFIIDYLPINSLKSGVFIDYIGIIIIYSIMSLMLQISQQFCKSISEIKTFALTGIISTIITAALGFLLIPKYKFDGYILSIFIANILSLLYVYLKAKLYRYIRIELFSIQKLQELLIYSVPLIPNSIIWLIVSYINRPLMEFHLGLHAIGIFALANKFPTLFINLYNNFAHSWQISVLEEFDKEGYTEYYNKIIFIAYSSLCIIISIFSIIIKYLIEVFLNERYFQTSQYVPILCLSVPFIAFASIVGANFSAIRKSKYYFFSSMWSAGSAVILNMILIPLYGIYGACWSCVGSYVLGAISRGVYSCKIIKLQHLKYYVLISLLMIFTVISISYFQYVLLACICFSINMCIVVYFYKNYYYVNNQVNQKSN